MGTVPQDPKRLEGALREARAELQDTLGELKGAMTASLDWRSWVRSHPWPVLAAATLIGLRLGRGRLI